VPPDDGPAPIRVLELRSVRGTGGGPEKTILLGAARADRSRFAVTVCYIRDLRDQVFEIDRRAQASTVDYVEIAERHSFDPASWGALRRLIRERQIDIVHAHDYKTDLLAYLVAKTDHVIPLATAHAWTGHSRREQLVYYPVDKRLLARFPRVVAVSGEIRQTLVAAGADERRIDVVLNGIDPEAFRRDAGRRAGARQEHDLPADAVVIGAVGRLEPQKRFDVLIDVFAALAPTRPGLRLLIAGAGSLRAALEQQIARLRLGAVCRLVGQADVIAFHHALDVFVQSSAYEGTPNVVLEAMALETPIVATAAGGTGELIEDGVHGLLVPTNDPDELRRAIERTLDDRAGAGVRVANARQRVETALSFDARTKAVERIYEELMRNRTHARDRGRQVNVSA
jgi:glycosyltransferase involved in cell wall biosynthesis